MNDQEFEQRATANPFDTAEEFLAAARETNERKELLNELKKVETTLRQTLNSVEASDKFKEQLLSLPEKEKAQAANDESFWTAAALKKYLPVAACLLIAIGALSTYWPAQPNQPSALEIEIFAHVYREEFLLEVETVIPMEEVNQSIASTLQAEFSQTSALADLEVHAVEDCWLAKENAIHMVMAGHDTGTVTVLMIPNSPIAKEQRISDDRFDGIITPTPNGNIVVIAEKQESVTELSNLIASNLNW